VVVVGVNYRLGAFGFLAHPELSPGNLGIADMVAALRWVRSHIAEFGGDLDAVTVVVSRRAPTRSCGCWLT